MRIVDAQIHLWGSGLPSNMAHRQVTSFAVRDFPGRFAILGAFPLNQPDKRALVDTWRNQPGMLGLRYGFLQEPMRGWLADGTLDWLWAAAERHPGLRLTIDHLGGRGGTTSLKDSAAMEHKATGAPGYCSGPYPFTSMHPYLRQIYDAFGPERMFWGTDITKMPCSWRQCVTMFTEELPWLSERDKDLVMGDAVYAWWGWKREARGC
jgi:hypothetical protein